MAMLSGSYLAVLVIFFHSGFACPYVPFLPAACILINSYLLIDLGWVLRHELTLQINFWWIFYWSIYWTRLSGSRLGSGFLSGLQSAHWFTCFMVGLIAHWLMQSTCAPIMSTRSVAHESCSIVFIHRLVHRKRFAMPLCSFMWK